VPPTFTNGWARGGTVSRRTANNKLTKLYGPSRKRSPKRLIVLLEPTSEGERPKKIFPALRARSVPPHFCSGPMPVPQFQIRPENFGKPLVKLDPIQSMNDREQTYVLYNGTVTNNRKLDIGLTCVGPNKMHGCLQSIVSFGCVTF